MPVTDASIAQRLRPCRDGGFVARRFGALPRALAMVLAVAMLASPAWAQPDGTGAEPTAEDRETARKLYRLGHERYRAGDYHGALESFQAADRIMGVPTTGLELGRTQAQLGLLVEARDRLLQVTRYPQRPDEPTPFTRARTEAAELAEQLAQRIPAIRVEVMGPEGPLTDDPAVQIKIDGREVRPELRTVARSVNPGSHVLEASAPGFAPQRETIKLADGDQRVVQLVLAPAAAEPAGGSSDAAGDDGSLVEPLMWTAFGIGGAGLVVGGITGALTLSTSSSLDEDCPNKVCPPDKQDDLDDASTLGDVSTGSFVVGGVGVAAGLVLLLVWSNQDEPATTDDAGSAPHGSAHVQLRPLVGPGWIGLTGRF